MPTEHAGSGFVHRYLDPSERVSELLFGLVMVLTFTLTAGLTIADRPDAVRELLLATLGCNVAWGLIDGGMYIMGAMMTRAQQARTLHAIQRAGTEADALRVIEHALHPTLVRLMSADERHRLMQGLLGLARRARPHRTRITRNDLQGAAACFVLVFVSTIPAAIPFLLVNDAREALRVSNALLIGLLGVAGWYWGSNANTNRWVSALVFPLFGLALVAIAIALGG